MKKTGLLLFALAAMVIGFSGCSDDDDDFDIVGSWNIDKSEIYMAGVPMDDFTVENDGTVTFNSDGTGTWVDDEGTDPFNWTLSGDKLTLSDDEDETTATLTTMTSERMVAEYEESWEDVSIKVVLTMSKI